MWWVLRFKRSHIGSRWLTGKIFVKFANGIPHFSKYQCRPDLVDSALCFQLPIYTATQTLQNYTRKSCDYKSSTVSLPTSIRKDNTPIEKCHRSHRARIGNGRMLCLPVRRVTWRMFPPNSLPASHKKWNRSKKGLHEAFECWFIGVKNTVKAIPWTTIPADCKGHKKTAFKN